jgi:hypothetical protein
MLDDLRSKLIRELRLRFALKRSELGGSRVGDEYTNCFVDAGHRVTRRLRVACAFSIPTSDTRSSR